MTLSVSPSIPPFARAASNGLASTNSDPFSYSPSAFASSLAQKPLTSEKFSRPARRHAPQQNRGHSLSRSSWPSSMLVLSFPHLQASSSHLRRSVVSATPRRHQSFAAFSAQPWKFRISARKQEVEAADAAKDDDGSHSKHEQTLDLGELLKDSNILTMVSSLQERLLNKLRALDEGELSDEEVEEALSDGEGQHKKSKQATVTTSEPPLLDADSGVESVVQEYKLSEEGTMSTVTVKVGDSTQETRNHLETVLAHVGIQAEMILEMIRTFSIKRFFTDFGKKDPGLEDLRFNPSMYSPKQGISDITQWTALELTLQRNSMKRIARDILYLVCAFTLFGIVRILEALVVVFSTSPPSYQKIFNAFNALDPLTIASLAHALRQPVLGMLHVDPTNLEEVSSLKAKFWAELHKFYERQWKVMATLAVARLFALIVKELPSAEWVTSKIKIVWDVTMALPIF